MSIFLMNALFCIFDVTFTGISQILKFILNFSIHLGTDGRSFETDRRHLRQSYLLNDLILCVFTL